MSVELQLSTNYQEVNENALLTWTLIFSTFCTPFLPQDRLLLGYLQKDFNIELSKPLVVVL